MSSEPPGSSEPARGDGRALVAGGTVPPPDPAPVPVLGASAMSEPLDPVEAIAEAVTAVPGVAGLHAGRFGEVATYLPRRRVSGIRMGPGRTDVHVSLVWGFAVHEVVGEVRRTAARHVGGRVDVFVEDVVPPGAATL